MIRALVSALLVSVVLHGQDAAWSWLQTNAKVKETGDLEWQPKPFVYRPSASVRYIDYESGRDSNPGTKAAPFKHHPWDQNAKGSAAACTGIHTYVFKRGVLYRGQLNIRESGAAGKPIQLTSDPGWGKGEAILCGSERVRGWKKGSPHGKIPDAGKVWYKDLSYLPRNVWLITDGRAKRIPLARTPNWKVTNQDDIKSEWFHWDNKGGRHFGNRVKVRGRDYHLAYDTKNITKSADYYRNAIVWSEWGWVMGTPYPAVVQHVDTKKRALGFSGKWGAASDQIISHNRYYLEDKPHYLDDPEGEFWVEKRGKRGRIHLRLPDGVDPNTAQVEVGQRISMINGASMNHIHISGLSFRYPNIIWQLDAGPWVRNVDTACIHLRGSGRDISITNCRFEYVHMPIRLRAMSVNDVVDEVIIADNVLQETDHGAFLLQDGGGWGRKDKRVGRLLDVKILRNKLSQIGKRTNRFGQGHAIEVDCAQTLEVSGNICHRLYGSGIFVYGAKRSLLAADRPLCRILIHHNKVTDSMLNTNDWGGIETWQGGPAYVFNNISGNPGGYWHWKFRNHPNEPGCARFGHAYYLDGAYKNYHFNNIAWGKSKDPLSQLGNTSAFQEIHSFQNTFFNNTVYNFVIGSRRQSPHAGRDKFLGNIWDGIGHRVFRHAKPAKTMAEANADHAGKQKEHFDYPTNAFSSNVFHDIASYGVFETSGRWLKTFDAYKQALAEHKALRSDLGVVAAQTPLPNAAKHDFRLAPSSAAKDRGAKVFVPWGLYAMVGEWNFYHIGGDPSTIIDEHWYMSPAYTDRKDYHNHPTYPLTTVNITGDDYVQGPLENWISGVLKLNGKNQYARIPHTSLHSTTAKTEEKLVNEESDWVKISAPNAMAPDKPSKITLELRQPGSGRLHCDLHWVKKGGATGGFNTSGGAVPITGAAPYTFTITPNDKPQLGGFLLITYISRDGTWKTRGKIARYSIGVGKEKGASSGFGKPEIDTSNFLIETYLQCEKGTSGIIMEKMRGTGYSLSISSSGHALLEVKGQQSARLSSKKPINDGAWHHVIAEADRKTKTLNIYLDGKLDATGSGIDTPVSLANTGDIHVGGSPNGRCLTGKLEFLRICLGTLKDAKTTIEELYAWQFNGPFLRDFTGREPIGKRDAGALEGR